MYYCKFCGHAVHDGRCQGRDTIGRCRCYTLLTPATEKPKGER
jgi:hypothetical protein